MFKPFTDQQQKFAEHLAKTNLPVSSLLHPTKK